MPRDHQEPTIEANGDETHPAFGVVTVHKYSSTPGAVLFQSDLQHGEYIVMQVHEATRKRDLKHDWVHPGRVLIEFAISQAQWAAMVSSMGNGSGTPVTITHIKGVGEIPGLPYQPRIAESLNETRAVIDELLADLKQAYAELDALEAAKAGARERRAAREKIGRIISYAAGNAEFAVESMNAQAERTVGQAKADIETIVAQAAQRHGIEAHLLATMGLSRSDLPAIEAKARPEDPASEMIEGRPLDEDAT